MSQDLNSLQTHPTILRRVSDPESGRDVGIPSYHFARRCSLMFGQNEPLRGICSLAIHAIVRAMGAWETGPPTILIEVQLVCADVEPSPRLVAASPFHLSNRVYRKLCDLSNRNHIKLAWHICPRLQTDQSSNCRDRVSFSAIHSPDGVSHCTMTSATVPGGKPGGGA